MNYPNFISKQFEFYKNGIHYFCKSTTKKTSVKKLLIESLDDSKRPPSFNKQSHIWT
jgi:hypothetical protein